MQKKNRIKDKLQYLDPYKYMDLFIAYLHKKNIKSKILDFTIYIIYSLILAYILLFLLGLIFGTSEAVMIVVSGSMEPNLHVGDIVFLTAPNNINTKDIFIDKNISDKTLSDIADIDYRVYINKEGKVIKEIQKISFDENKYYNIDTNSDIIVYLGDFQGRKIIHRAVFKLIANDGNYYLTKGDNQKTNYLIDQDCSTNNCISYKPIKEDEVISKYLFKIPYLGLIKIIPLKLLGLN